MYVSGSSVWSSGVTVCDTLAVRVCTEELFINYLLRPSLSHSERVRRQYIIVCMVALFISPLTYVEEGFGVHSLSTSPEPLVNVVFRYRPIHLSPKIFFFFPFKFVMTILCVALPLPVGLFDPVFLLGGVFGRIVGE